jgi:hypothetical protein
VYTVRDLVKTYKAGKVRANDGLSFEILPGETFGLLGPNGAGKTTLVGQLTGLPRPDSGPLLLYGHDISRDSRFATEMVAVLSQTPLPLHNLTVEEALTITGHADIAFDAYLPALVDREWHADANGAGQLSQSVAEVAGPGVAGMLIRVFSAPAAIAVDAVSYLVSAVSLALIHAPETSEIFAAERHIIAEIAIGMRVLFSHPWLRAITVTAALVVFFASMFQAVFVLYLDRTLHFDAGLIGLIFALGGAGGIVGATAAPVLARRMGHGRAAVAGETIMVLGGQGYVIVVLTMPSHLLVVVLVTLIECFVAGGNALCNVAFITIEQHIVPSRLLGRTGAAFRVSALGVTGLLGAVLGGLLGSVLNPGAVITVSVTAMLSAVVWIWRSPLRATGDLPPPLEEHQR